MGCCPPLLLPSEWLLSSQQLLLHPQLLQAPQWLLCPNLWLPVQQVAQSCQLLNQIALNTHIWTFSLHRSQTQVVPMVMLRTV